MCQLPIQLLLEQNAKLVQNEEVVSDTSYKTCLSLFFFLLLPKKSRTISLPIFPFSASTHAPFFFSFFSYSFFRNLGGKKATKKNLQPSGEHQRPHFPLFNTQPPLTTHPSPFPPPQIGNCFLDSP